MPEVQRYPFSMKKMVIFGTGGHAKVIHDILLKQGLYEPAAFFSLEKGIKSFLGIPHFHQEDFSQSSFDMGIVAIGDNWIRSQVVNFILSVKKDFTFVNAIHPSAQIGNNTVFGKGVVVMANTAINPDSKIGSHVIINTSSSIDHDCTISNFASIAPGAILGGNVTVGEYSAISLGAQVIHGMAIGQHSVVGAGSLVLNNIEDKVVAFGCPCKTIRRRAENEKYL